MRLRKTFGLSPQAISGGSCPRDDRARTPLCIAGGSLHNPRMDARPAPEPLRLLKQVLSEQGEMRLAILFGSRAMGRTTAQSDLDLAVMLPALMDAPEKIALIERLAASTGLQVDLKRVGEPLLGQILKYGGRLLGSNADNAALMSATSSTRPISCPTATASWPNGGRRGSGIKA